jgi:hypothetical protein
MIHVVPDSTNGMRLCGSRVRQRPGVGVPSTRSAPLRNTAPGFSLLPSSEAVEQFVRKPIAAASDRMTLDSLARNIASHENRCDKIERTHRAEEGRKKGSSGFRVGSRSLLFS